MNLSNLTIKPSDPSDLNLIKSLMLDGLKQDPYAFSVSYNEYYLNSNEWWSSYLNNFLYKINSQLFIIYNNEIPIGLGGMIYSSKSRTSHIATIVWIYVMEQYRGQGAGKLLIQTILNTIEENKRIKKITILMNSTQKSALSLYQSFRFKIVGNLEAEMFINNKYIDQYILERFIN